MLLTQAWCVAGIARAQVGAGFSADTDYQYRGVSLSDGRPVVGASLAYDGKDGLYSGGTALAEATADSGLQPFGYLVYLGYSHKLSADASWDLGVTNAGFTQVLDGRRSSDDYTEVYAGATYRGLSFHAYYTPRYLGDTRGAVYADLDGTISPSPQWRLIAHGGFLTDVGPRNTTETYSFRADASAGIAREFRNFELRLTITGATPRPVYPAGYRQPAVDAVLGARLFF